MSATTGVGAICQQLVVELEDLAPVGVLRRRGVAVHGVDRGLDLVRAGLVAAQAGSHQGLALVDQRRGPTGCGPGRQQHHRPVGRGPGRPTRLGEQQQGEQPDGLGLVGHQLGEQAGEADRLGAESARISSSPLDAV